MTGDSSTEGAVSGLHPDEHPGSLGGGSRPGLWAEWEDPTLSRVSFWSSVDARDVGSACRAALEGYSDRHEVCVLAAADTRARRSLRQLMAQQVLLRG